MFKSAMPKASKAFEDAIKLLAQAEIHESHSSERLCKAKLACTYPKGMSTEEKIRIAKEAVELCSRAYHFLPWDIQRKEEICIAYVKNDSSGMNLHFLQLQHLVTDRVALAAVSACGRALKYASSKQRNNSAIVDAAREQDASAVQHAGTALTNTRFNELEFCKKKVAKLEADIEALKAQSTAKQKEHADDRASKRKKPGD